MRFLSLFMLAFTYPFFAQQPPKVMTKIEVFLEGPDVPAGSFATKPKVMYRAGTRYCRIEEALDAENGIHGLAITNEPDAWMVNLVTKSARHVVDPGPTFNCHLPIFPEIDKNLEFGFELDYFKAKGSAPQKGPVLQNKSTTQYKIQFGNATLGMFAYGTPERPMAVVGGIGNGKIFWFTGWGDLPFDPSLFIKPEGVKIEEQKP